MAAALVDLFGPALRGKEGDVETAVALEGKVNVGVYFASATTVAEFTATFAAAYTDALSAKGLEVIFVSTDEAEPEEGAEDCYAAMPWLALPADRQAALIEKFEVVAGDPRLVLLDAEGEVAVAEGIEKLSADPTGEEFPWKDEEEIPTLSENEILHRMGNCAPEPGEEGLKGMFINGNNYAALGLRDQEEEADDVPFSGPKLKPYIFINREFAMQEVKKKGFASDFHPYQKDIEKFQGENLLVMFEPTRSYGEKLIFCLNAKSYDREWARISEIRQGVMDAFEKSLIKAATGGGGGGADGEEEGEEDEGIENIGPVRDLPRDCGDWKSETMEATHAEVLNFSVANSRPPMQVMITRPRAGFGKTCKFSDSGENIQNCRPMKDPNFGPQRKEIETGIQAVKDMRTTACQTTWFRPVNKSTQYSPNDFLQRDKAKDDKVDELSEFLTAVSVSVEEALQTNETVDIFQEEFAHLGEEDAGAVSETHSNIKEHRNFHDVTYTKGKRIEWVEWVPNSTDMLACSCCENLPFTERLETAGKATVSTILIWSFQDAFGPHTILLAPWEVSVFKFYPSDEKFLLAGLGSGQLAVWKLCDADLGYCLREKAKNGGEEEKTSSIPTVAHKCLSVIDESHKKAVLAIEWLPAMLEIERRGRGASDKNPKDGPVKYFATIAGDGQVMIWDFQVLLDAINDQDYQWKPVHRIQLQRQDSGTEMGCCHLLYCHDRVDDKGNKQLTNFFASTEEGELIFGDWAARVEEDRKPEYCKKRFTVSKTFRPMLSLERSPFFPDILLGVTDWAFYLWKDGVEEHLFQSSYTSTYFSRGLWSPTRPSVIFLGLVSGGIDIWDFSDQSHKASLSDAGASASISSMAFLKFGDPTLEQRLAVGDAGGHLHVHTIPKNLVRQAGREFDNMQKFLEREEQRVAYFRDRRQELAELKETMEKQAQMAIDAAAEMALATKVDEDKLDEQAEVAYRKLEEECIEFLKEQGKVWN